MARVSIVLLIAVWPGALFAQTRPPQEFHVSLASSPIVDDGRLEEAAWQIDLTRTDRPFFMKIGYAWVR